MNFDTLIIVLVVTAMFAIGAIESRRFGKKMNEKDFAVRIPRIYPLMFLLATLACCALLIAMRTLYQGDTDGVWIYILPSSLTVFCFLFFVYFMTWKLVIKDDLIVYTPFLGMRREIKISDITRVTIRFGELRAYAGNKIQFRVGLLLTPFGARRLVSRLESEEHIRVEWLDGF